MFNLLRQTVNFKCDPPCKENCPGHKVICFDGRLDKGDQERDGDIIFDFYYANGDYHMSQSFNPEQWDAMVKAQQSIEKYESK